MNNVSSVLNQRELEQKITSVHPSSSSSPPLHYLCFSVDFFATGGMFSWFMKQIKEKRVDYDLTLDTWTRHTFVAPCVSRRRRRLLLISSQSENDLDSPGCWMCLHTLSADDIVSQKASLSAVRSGALFTVTKAPIHLPSWWNSVQSHRSLLSSDCMHDGVNGYWSFWLADSQDIWMLRLLDIFIFAVNCKLPSVIRLHKGFFSPKKEIYISLLSLIMNIHKRSSPCAPPELSIPPDCVLNNMSLIHLLFQSLFLPWLYF